MRGGKKGEESEKRYRGRHLEAAVEAGEGLLADEVEEHHARCTVVGPIVEWWHVRISLPVRRNVMISALGATIIICF